MQNYGIICDIGGKNKGNQDSAFFTEIDLVIAPSSPKMTSFAQKCVLAILCDGVSASDHGEEGSSFVVRALPAKIITFLLSHDLDLAEIQPFIEKAIHDTNSEMISTFSAYIQQGKVPKTTLVGALVIGPWIWIFNIGDSRLYLLKDGDISQVSIDHIGTGAHHEITQAMGQENISPAIKVYNWAYESDYAGKQLAFHSSYHVVMCSDGLTDTVGPNEINDIILAHKGPQAMEWAVMELYSLTMDRKVQDNVSIIAVDLKDYFETLSFAKKIRLTYP